MATPSVSSVPELNFPDLKHKGFKIHAIPKNLSPPPNRARRDFYKIGLVNGSMTVYYGDRVLKSSGTVLFFINPNVQHSVVKHSKKLSGFSCVFTETFIAGRERKEILKHSSLYNTELSPILHLNKEQARFITGIFQKMMDIHKESYDYKDELLKNCIEIVLHEAVSIQPAPNTLLQKNGATRITNLFVDLLERQFPIETSSQPLKLRTPYDFANSLSVHINYLNRSVKQVTGKPTSLHIAERIAAEAKALLLYTDWGVADIAYSLGFEYPTYFNNYFKRVTGVTPNSLRKRKV